MKYVNKILIGTLIFTIVGFSNITVHAQNANTTPEPSPTNIPQYDCDPGMPGIQTNCQNSSASSSYQCSKDTLKEKDECLNCCQSALPSSPGQVTSCENSCKASFNQLEDKPIKTEKPEKTPDSTDEQFYKPLGGEDYVCGGLMSVPLRDMLRKIYKTISLVMVVAVVILGMMDFFKAVTSDNADAMKKATKTFTNRLIVVVLIAILPVLLDLLLSLFGNESMKNCIDYFGK